MQLPDFPECDRPLVKSLFHHSDLELLALFQRHPERGQYFTAIFCRYSPIVYALISHSSRSPVQSDYLFALTWRHIYHELAGLDLRVYAASVRSNSSSQSHTLANDPTVTSNLQTTGPIALQSWLIDMTAICINSAQLPPVESIYYSLSDASPPLWCYLERALEQLPAIGRLMVVMAQTFHWSETRIAAYLQAEGEAISPYGVREKLQQAYQVLQNALPADIREIYLGEEMSLDPKLETPEY